MIGNVAPTDFGWYEFLRDREVSEVNFWTPSARRAFSAPESSPFFFKLKKPHNAICGFGYFSQWARLPDWWAWETFGQANGCENLLTMRARVGSIREGMRYVADGPLSEIGCILITQPVFFSPDAWIPQPNDWPIHMQRARKYDLAEGEGRRIWEACLERVAGPTTIREFGEHLLRESKARYGEPKLLAPRLGQGTFRIAVMEAYRRSCAATSERSLPVLEAVHIRPFAADGPHEVRNGILMRADLHRLFDRGYLTITKSLRLEVSSRLHEDFNDGHSYRPLHGKEISSPAVSSQQPALEYLSWHNERVYLG